MTEPMRANDGHFTYADLLTWTEDERWELIDGVAYDMSPAPSRRHQVVAGALFAQLFNILEGHPCQAFIAPFDVRLPRNAESALTTTTVVQPDITVVCEREKLDERGCFGAPTVVIEVLSPESATRDFRDKFRAYERAGVPEYWIVSPHENTVLVFILDAHGHYGAPTVFGRDDQAPVRMLEGVEINLARVFPEETPNTPSAEGEIRL